MEFKLKRQLKRELIKQQLQRQHHEITSETVSKLMPRYYENTKTNTFVLFLVNAAQIHHLILALRADVIYILHRI